MVHLSEVTDEHFEEIPPSTDADDDDFEDYSSGDDASISDSDSHADPLLRPAGRKQHIHQPHSHHHHKSARRAAAAQLSESESEDEDEDEDEDMSIEETLVERLVALKDILPIKQRVAVAGFVGGVWGWVSWGGRAGGKIMYVLSTGALLVGVPYALAVAEEGGLVEMEREMKLQQLGSDMIGGGGAATAGDGDGGRGSGLREMTG